MSVVAIIVIAAVVVVALALAAALPRLRGRTRLARGGRRPSPLSEPATTEYDRETEVLEPRRAAAPRSELIVEGEALRERVEAELQARRMPGYGRNVLGERDELARQIAQEQAAGGVPAAEGMPGPDPMLDGGRRSPAYAAGDPLASRDELAWQIQQQHGRVPVAGEAAVHGPPVVDPRLRPAASVSDPLELQLQEAAARNHRAVAPRAAGHGGRRMRFARPRSVDPEAGAELVDPRLAP